MFFDFKLNADANLVMQANQLSSSIWYSSLEASSTGNDVLILSSIPISVVRRRGEEVISSIRCTVSDAAVCSLSNGMYLSQQGPACNSVSAVHASAFSVAHPTSLGLSLTLSSSQKQGCYFIEVAGLGLIALARLGTAPNRMIVGQFFKKDVNETKITSIAQAASSVIDSFVRYTAQEVTISALHSIFRFTTLFNKSFVERCLINGPLVGGEYTRLSMLPIIYLFEALAVCVKALNKSPRESLITLAKACGSLQDEPAIVVLEEAHKAGLLQSICDICMPNEVTKSATELCIDNDSEMGQKLQIILPLKYPLRNMANILEEWAVSPLFSDNKPEGSDRANQPYDMNAPIRRSSGKEAEAILGVRRENNLQAAIVSAVARAMPFALEPSTARAMATLLTDAPTFTASASFLFALKDRIPMASDRDQVIRIVEQAMGASFGEVALGTKRRRE